MRSKRSSKQQDWSVNVDADVHRVLTALTGFSSTRRSALLSAVSPVITRQGQGRPTGHCGAERARAEMARHGTGTAAAERERPVTRVPQPAVCRQPEQGLFVCADQSLKPRTATQPPHSTAHTTTRTHTHTAAHGAQASPALVPVRSLLTRATHKPPPPPQTDLPACRASQAACETKSAPNRQMCDAQRLAARRAAAAPQKEGLRRKEKVSKDRRIRKTEEGLKRRGDM